MEMARDIVSPRLDGFIEFDVRIYHAQMMRQHVGLFLFVISGA